MVESDFQKALLADYTEFVSKGSQSNFKEEILSLVTSGPNDGRVIRVVNGIDNYWHIPYANALPTRVQQHDMMTPLTRLVLMSTNSIIQSKSNSSFACIAEIENKGK